MSGFTRPANNLRTLNEALLHYARRKSFTSGMLTDRESRYNRRTWIL